ncbi:MAG: DUF1360 domain-containing protein [Bacillota bacterium]
MMGIGWLELAVLILASFRLTHLVVLDSITEPLRRWVAGGRDPLRADPASMGRARAWFVALVTCYWCTGVWVSAALVLLYAAFPSLLVRTVLLILAVAGGQAFVESLILPRR